jgi:hypothetical protein
MGFPLHRLTILLLCAQFSLGATGTTITPRYESIYFKESLIVESNGVANIHMGYNVPLTGELSIHYGDCDLPRSASKESHHHMIGETNVGDYSLSKRHLDWTGSRPERFVWFVPENARDGGCLYAYSGSDPVGKSAPVTVLKRRSRRGIALGDIGDAEGPWFDGVEYLSAKGANRTFVAQAKSKSIGILGAGMSGLMSAVGACLSSSRIWLILINPVFTRICRDL